MSDVEQSLDQRLEARLDKIDSDWVDMKHHNASYFEPPSLGKPGYLNQEMERWGWKKIKGHWQKAFTIVAPPTASKPASGAKPSSSSHGKLKKRPAAAPKTKIQKGPKSLKKPASQQKDQKKLSVRKVLKKPAGKAWSHPPPSTLKAIDGQSMFLASDKAEAHDDWVDAKEHNKKFQVGIEPFEVLLAKALVSHTTSQHETYDMICKQ